MKVYCIRSLNEKRHRFFWTVLSSAEFVLHNNINFLTLHKQSSHFSTHLWIILSARREDVEYWLNAWKTLFFVFVFFYLQHDPFRQNSNFFSSFWTVEPFFKHQSIVKDKPGPFILLRSIPQQITTTTIYLDIQFIKSTITSSGTADWRHYRLPQ